jgi:UDP-2-acetamido-2,6-beta-L-arabino-hexul-4-ose reductase
VVATFCNNIAKGLPIEIHDPTKEVKLVYVDDVVNKVLEIISGNENNTFTGIKEVFPQYEINLGSLAEKIHSFRESRNNLLLPEVDDDFTKKLYSTYLSYLPEGEFSYKLTARVDNRGSLTELLKSSKIGQIFVSTTKPGITRGNHYHHTKTEKFIVIKGTAEIKFRKIDDDKVITYKVNGDNIEVVDIPPGYTHSITNTGNEEVITLFWSNEIFNADKPDTTFLEV